MNHTEHYHGHRGRLKERFLQANGQGLADYELIELILFLAIPRGDVKPLAKALLSRFGTLGALFKAEDALLLEISGIGPSVVHVLRLMQVVIEKSLQQEILGKPILNSWQGVIDYCHAAMAHESREMTRLLFLDRKNQLIRDEVQQKGTTDHTPLYPREIVKRALDLGASAIVIVHNHPSGDPTPSRCDIDATIFIQQAARLLGIDLHDHIIIGKERHVSLKSLGFI